MACMDLDRFRDLLSEGKLSRRDIGKVLASAGVVTLALPGPAAANATIEVFTWAGYDNPALRPGSDEAAGSAPGMLVYSDNDEAFDTVRAGYTPTLTQPTNHTIDRWRDAGLLKPIDTSRLENYGAVIPALAAVPGLREDGAVFAVPFAWGNSSVIYRRDLAPDYAGRDTWNVLWDADLAGRLSQRDSLDAAVLTAAMTLGIDDPHGAGAADLERIRERLIEQRELLAFYWSGRADVEQALVSGEVIAAYGWNASYAALSRKGIDVAYMNPAEGILTWVDCTCLIAGGPGDEQEAHDFIDAGLSVEAGAALIESFGYGAANAGAFEVADAGRVAELGMENPQSLLENARFFSAWSRETRRNASLMFDEIRAGF